jgi:hypothetical protein
MLIARLEVPLLFQSLLDILIIYCLLSLLEGSCIPAGLTTDVARVVTLLGAVPLFQYIHMSLINMDRKGKLLTSYMEGFKEEKRCTRVYCPWRSDI